MGKVCFNIEETTSSKDQAAIKGKNMLPVGSIFFPLKVAPMRIENKFKWHLIEKPLELKYANVNSLKSPNFGATNI